MMNSWYLRKVNTMLKRSKHQKFMLQVLLIPLEQLLLFLLEQLLQDLLVQHFLVLWYPLSSGINLCNGLWKLVEHVAFDLKLCGSIPAIFLRSNCWV